MSLERHPRPQLLTALAVEQVHGVNGAYNTVNNVYRAFKRGGHSGFPFEEIEFVGVKELPV